MKVINQRTTKATYYQPAFRSSPGMSGAFIQMSGAPLQMSGAYRQMFGADRRSRSSLTKDLIRSRQSLPWQMINGTAAMAIRLKPPCPHKPLKGLGQIMGMIR